MKRQDNQKLANIALLIIGLVSGLLLVEVALRILQPPRLAITRFPCIYTLDEQLGYRYIPNASGHISRNFEIDNVVEINSMGFHDIEHNPQETVDKRILVVGDSFTAAMEVEIAQGWTQTLQRHLQEMGHSVEVINLGLDGTGTDVHLALLKEYAPVLKPNLVILAFYKNDIEDMVRKRYFRTCYQDQILVFQNLQDEARLKTYVNQAYDPTPFSSRLFNYVYTFRLIMFLSDQEVAAQSNYLKPLGREIRANPVDVDGLFEEFVALAQKQGFRLLVVPVPQKSEPTGSLEKLQSSVSNLTLAKMEVVDISPVITDVLESDHRFYEDLFWKYDGHFNIYGNQVFGAAVAEVVDSRFKTTPMVLHVPVTGMNLWTVVQWQDDRDNWHNVDDWAGELGADGTIRWWVSIQNFNQGPFRWVVSAAPGGQILATSPEFYLPNAQKSLWVEMQ